MERENAAMTEQRCALEAKWRVRRLKVYYSEQSAIVDADKFDNMRPNPNPLTRFPLNVSSNRFQLFICFDAPTWII